MQSDWRGDCAWEGRKQWVGLESGPGCRDKK